MELIIESIELDYNYRADKVRVLYYYHPVDDACREIIFDLVDLQARLSPEVQAGCMQQVENEDGKWKYFDWTIAKEYFYDDLIETAECMALEIINQSQPS